MIDRSQPKVIGAFVIGLAIVFGAYTLSNFGKPYVAPTATQTATVSTAPERVIIPVIDSNNDGIEDWREDFVDNTVEIYTDKEYEPPTTLTGQVGIAFLESYIRSEGYGEFGQTKAEIVEDTVKKISKFGSDTVFDIKDIVISENDSPEDVRLYANQLASIIIDNNVEGLDHELVILQEAINTQNKEKMGELVTIANVYMQMRDNSLNLPVPRQLIKQHLDFINVSHALYNDIEAMSKSIEDPMLSLVRLKRYEEDALGLSYVFENLFTGIEPYAKVFQKDDPAILFVGFSNKLQ
jgi:hypothetical protein